MEPDLPDLHRRPLGKAAFADGLSPLSQAEAKRNSPVDTGPALTLPEAGGQGRNVMRKTAILVLAAATLAACAETGPAPPPIPPPIRTAPPNPPQPPPTHDLFRESDFAWSYAPGSGKVVGQLAYRGMGRYTCGKAILTPETPWTRERMQILYLSDLTADVPVEEARARTPTAHEQEYERFVRVADCDPSGRFTFSGLPNGAWYMITSATPVGGGAKMALMRRVETHGATVAITLR
jgi:hypothetical protein